MRRSVLLALAVPLALAARAEAQTQCSPSKVIVLFDRSTSMVEGKIGDETKWDIATAGLEGVVGAYQSQAQFGLEIFPKDARTCKTGASEVVSPELDALDDITSKLDAAKPTNRNFWTPMGQSLQKVAALPDWDDTAHRKFVILVTDGRQSCPGPGIYDQVGELDQIWPTDQIVEQATALRAKNVSLYVVGFGHSSVGDSDGVDAFTLNQLALAGGTSVPGCDPNGIDPTDPRNCYFQADDAAHLAAALDAIAVQISGEICDGLDNNCDGHIDEGLTRPCSSICGAGQEHCVLGEWVGCTAPEPEPEVCGDGKDNDCNGQTDETCECQNGDTQDCGMGQCAGTSVCVNHEWSACDGPAPTHQSECDGIDHDCNGVIDRSGCECVPGTQERCGPADVGQCRHGTRTCDANGHWGDCVGAIGPSPEVCDGIDNDCDGHVDNPVLGGGDDGSDDDVSHGLCRADQICQNGACVIPPASTTTPPPNGGSGGFVTGEASAGCMVGGASSEGGSVFLAALVGALVFLTRRRGAR